MKGPATTVTWELPVAVKAAVGPGAVFRTDAERMGLVVRLAQVNVDIGGGPFAAAVFDDVTGEVRSVGVNLVVPSRTAVAHAEMVAIALAGVGGGSFDLSVPGPATLVSSTEPCAMCLGAVAWSGVHRLVCGARDSDARAIGFDEGHKPPDWLDGLARRGIEVVLDVCRDTAAAVLHAYAAAGNPIYNAGSGAEHRPEETSR